MEDLACARRIATRRHSADVHHMHEGSAPGYELTAIVDGAEHIDVGLVDRCQIRIVENKNVVGFDLASVAEAFDDSFDRYAGAGHMPAGGFAGGEDFTVGAIESRGIVLHLRRVDSAADSFEGDAGFLGDLV